MSEMIEDTLTDPLTGLPVPPPRLHKAQPRIVVIGEALIDVINNPDGVKELPGGSPANVAITLARLERKPELVTSFADDARGNVLRTWLESDGVQYSADEPSTERTSTAQVTLNDDGGASYQFDLAWDLSHDAALAAVDAPDLGVVHTGSIATVLQPGAGAVKEALQVAQGRALITFDPNARPSITPGVAAARAEVERFVTLSDVVKVSQEDLAWYYPGIDPVDAAVQWAAAGPVLVVVTLGAEGSVLVRGSDVLHLSGNTVSVADTIGAGDTYMGALIDALISLGCYGPAARERLAALSADELRDAALFANYCAGITVSRPGHNPPTRAELPNPSFHPTNLL